MVIYEGPDLYVRWRPAGRAIAVVTFSVRVAPNGKARGGFGEAFFAKHDISAVHFIAKHNHWWHTPDMEAALAEIARLDLRARHSTIATYGSSMGGHGALAFAGRLSADLALAMSPQASVHDPALPTADVWRHEMRDIPERYRVDRAALEGVRPVIIVDPFLASDMAHVRAAARVAPVETIHTPFAGHDTAQYLQDLGMLGPTVLAVLEKRFDAARFRADLRRGRAGSLTYWLRLRGLAKRTKAVRQFALDRSEAILSTQVAARDPRLPHRQAAQIIHAKCMRLTAAGKTAEALALARAYADGYPDQPHGYKILAEVQMNTGALDDAAAVARKACKWAPHDALAHLLGARIALRAGRIDDAAQAYRMALDRGLKGRHEWVEAAIEARASALPGALKDEITARAVSLNANNARALSLLGQPGAAPSL